MPARALVADDDPAVRSVLAAALASDGFDVTAAASGAEALAALLGALGPALDVAVIDCVMPDLGGPAVLGRARAAGYRVPVLLVSASVDPDDIAGALADPPAAFLPKPFARADLLNAVGALLSARDVPHAVTAGETG